MAQEVADRPEEKRPRGRGWVHVILASCAPDPASIACSVKQFRAVSG